MEKSEVHAASSTDKIFQVTEVVFFNRKVDCKGTVGNAEGTMPLRWWTMCYLDETVQ